ncbi:hypothetical protein TCAL_00059 [Tigriopus californicus]|uniref:Uncharacterized protein n=1 Tax=Tigriopus californicus TaxID=6832 RepID=A0A553PFI2_TIGCA|nr:hypothetical protein TCAL_00059 [Tigriopus californicus]
MTHLRGILIASLLLTPGWLLSLVACDATPITNNNSNNNNNNPNQQNEINHPYNQFHIQTDEGSNRFFKYQTKGGQFRKETRLDDGSVVGSYGWIDAHGLLRLWDYVADKKGYRIVKTRILRFDEEEEEEEEEKEKEKEGEEPLDNQIAGGRKDASSTTHAKSKRTKSRALFDGGPLTSKVMFDSSSFSGRSPVTDIHNRDNTEQREQREEDANDVVKQIVIDQDNEESKKTPSVADLSRMHFRLQRRIDGANGVTHIQVEPLFSQPQEESHEISSSDITTTEAPRGQGPSEELHHDSRRRGFQESDESRGTPRRHGFFKKIEPRGEGTRLQYTPRRAAQIRRRNKSARNSQTYHISGERGGKFVIVKRKRRPSNPEKLSPHENDLSVNYETENIFHLEKQSLNSGGQERRGEYGYIDPFGIRRVVVYSIGAEGDLVKIKENDFVALSKPLQRAPGTPDNPQLQYHVQTDQGPERFFRFQTLSGQYRKEQILPDGSVVGSYGWVDPNGVLRLFDYVSDNLGYRIEKQRLFKVGKITEETATLETRGGDLNLGFEVFPLDFDSDPAFNGLASAKGGVPLGGTSGFRSIHGPEGSFHLTPSYQVASLTSTNDPANPISKQGQATFFEGDPILVQPIQEKPKLGLETLAHPGSLAWTIGKSSLAHNVFKVTVTQPGPAE